MSLWDNLGGLAVIGGGGGIAIKWVVDAWREDRAQRRGEDAESVALKTLRAEVTRLATRVEELEKDVGQREDAARLVKVQHEEIIRRLNVEIDHERIARRAAEDLLDAERRARISLEDRIAKLEAAK